MLESELEPAPTVEADAVSSLGMELERVYDTFRPHHSLDGRTPAEDLEQCHPSLVSSSLSHMY